MDGKTGALILEAAKSDGFYLRLRAIADPPARAIEQRYRLVQRIPTDPDQASIHGLVMERVGDEVTL